MSASTTTTATAKKKRPVIFWVIAFAIPFVIIPLPFIWFPLKIGVSQTAAEPTTGTLLITTSYSGIPIHTDPDENIMAGPVTLVDWEKAVNGIPSQRILIGKPTIDLIPQGSRGARHTIAYRILEGQGVTEVELAFVKYRGENPPSGWYETALKNKLYKK